MEEKNFTNDQVNVMLSFIFLPIMFLPTDQIEAFLADAVRLVKEAGNMIAEVNFLF